MAEVAALLEGNPGASAGYAIFELNAGRLEWLAEHIRRCDLQIDPHVAKVILRLIDGTHPELALKIVRKPGLNPKVKPRLQTDLRDFNLAMEVARRGGFEPKMRARVCHDVGQAQRPRLAGSTVQRLVKRFQDFAIVSLRMKEGDGHPRA